jgi:hypothetical protein
MAGTLTPSWFLYFTDSVGAPLSGGKVYTYVTGTTTPATVYQDAALAVPWSNPIILPADGKVTIYQDAETIKAVVYNSADVLQDSYDPIASTALNSSLGGSIFSFEGDDFYPITVTAYPTGTAVSAIHPGTTLFSVDSNNLVGTYVLQGMLQVSATETVSAALVNLSEGSPDTAIVEITSTATAGELKSSTAITFSAGGTARTYAVKTKTAAGVTSSGWAFNLVRTA